MERRIYNDVAVKERAQLAVEEAPKVLEDILTDNDASARHRIEASKELRAFAHSGKNEQAADRERFVITIDLSQGGGEVLHFDQPIRPIESNQPMIDVSDDKGTDGE